MKKASFGIVVTIIFLLGVVPGVIASDLTSETLLMYLHQNPILERKDDPDEIIYEDAIQLLAEIKAAPDVHLSDHQIEQIKKKADECTHDSKMAKDTWIRLILEAELGSFFEWSIENKHRYHVLLVEYGLLEEPINLLPAEGDLTKEQALKTAKDRIVDFYDITLDYIDGLHMNEAFMIYDTGIEKERVWSFAFYDKSGEDTNIFYVELHNDGTTKSITGSWGKTNLDPLDRFFVALEAERGDFYMWSVADKAWLSSILPDMIAIEQEAQRGIPPILQAIASYRFTTPTDHDLTEEQAVDIALETIKKKYGLDNDFASSFRIARSLYQDQENTRIWQIGFWHTPGTPPPTEFVGGRIRIDAETGDLISVDAHEGFTYAGYIQYEDML